MKWTPEELAARREEFAALRRERERLKESYPAAHRWLRDLLARHDPLGLISVGAPNDEYEEQADTLLPRLLELRRSGEPEEGAVLRIVHEEFVKWYGAAAAGTAERYAASAIEIQAGLGQQLVSDGVDGSAAAGVD